MRKIFLSTVVSLLILTASTAFARNSIVATYFVVNCRESITLRAAPSVYARELAQIPLGQAVGFIENAPNGFCKVNYDGLIGYALAEYLAPSQESYTRGATVVNCRQSITLRENPSTSAYELAQIPLGARVRYLGVETNSFYKVQYRGMVGYVLKTYIALD
ncbi:MAG: SH3 domain-containing protein [Selenomonadaceae bacterium]|nr:SH3 domain-containing protein [Selenomonadaceae bacterium]